MMDKKEWGRGVEACPQYSVGEAGLSERKRCSCSKPAGSRLRLKMSNKIISNHLAVYMRCDLESLSAS